MREERTVGDRTESRLNVDAPHADVTHAIIGVAMRVHNELGPGHREEVYQQAMVRLLPDRGLEVVEQVPVQVALDGDDLLTYYLDLLVEREVIVELKAFSHPVTNDDLAQVIDYLAATGHPVALLLNFGRARLEFRRVFPPRRLAEHRRRRWTRPACE